MTLKDIQDTFRALPTYQNVDHGLIEKMVEG
jgi:hypothetical protein